MARCPDLQIVWIVQTGDNDAVQPAAVRRGKHLDGAVAGTDDVDKVSELGHSTHLTVCVDTGQV